MEHCRARDRVIPPQAGIQRRAKPRDPRLRGVRGINAQPGAAVPHFIVEGGCLRAMTRKEFEAHRSRSLTLRGSDMHELQARATRRSRGRPCHIWSLAPALTFRRFAFHPFGQRRTRKRETHAGRSVRPPASASIASPASSPEANAVPVEAIDGNVR